MLMAINGQATVLKEATQTRNPHPANVAGAFGYKVPETKEPHSFMARLNEKAAQDITLKRGTLWFIGTVLVLAGVVFSYGSSAIAWVRADESQKMQILQLQNDVTAIKDSLKALTATIEQEREARRLREIENAKALGYQLKAAEGNEHGAKR